VTISPESSIWIGKINITYTLYTAYIQIRIIW